GIERETGKDGGISWKYRLFKYLTIPFYPLIKRFCSNVDIDLTEDEIYFGFRRKGYDFLGIPFKKRAAWAEEKDKKLGNVILGNNINV
ncbi:MAG TPA: hypothetical protein VKO61_01235, partial [Candidatus Paceibacterota bacterium]|nr:hypothetical protein [Candidatus Paceibacterota bacterium]